MKWTPLIVINRNTTKVSSVNVNVKFSKYELYLGVGPLAALLLFWFVSPRGVGGAEEALLLQGVDGAVLGVPGAADAGVFTEDAVGVDGVILGVLGVVKLDLGVPGVVRTGVGAEVLVVTTGVAGAELGVLLVFFGVLDLLQAVSVFRVMRRGCDLA